MTSVTITQYTLQEAVQQNLRRGQAARYSVGVAQRRRSRELLVRPASPGSREPYLLLGVSDGAVRLAELPRDCVGVLSIGRTRGRGSVRAFVRTAGGWEPARQLKIVGPGMHVLSLRPERPQPPRFSPGATPAERWSRTIGALGPAAWHRLRSLCYGIVGVGRTGAMMAQSLVDGWAVRRIVAIDPDVVERHNLGEMPVVAASDCGRAKPAAVGRRLSVRGPGRTRIVPVHASITDYRALRAVQACDVLFGCVDHDAARLATTALATVYCRPYVDIATGIHGQTEQRRMGADIRLVLPGQRCLLCQGGLADAVAARQTLASPEAEQAAYADRDWRGERAGSLRSLNQLAAAVALRLWEDFVAERVAASTWVHLEFDRLGNLIASYPPHLPTGLCRLCRLAGMGDGGLAHLGQVFRDHEPNPESDASIPPAWS